MPTMNDITGRYLRGEIPEEQFRKEVAEAVEARLHPRRLRWLSFSAVVFLASFVGFLLLLVLIGGI